MALTVDRVALGWRRHGNNCLVGPRLGVGSFLWGVVVQLYVFKRWLSPATSCAYLYARGEETQRLLKAAANS